MSADLSVKNKWEIDCILEGLLGAEVRVAARSFSPARWSGENSFRFVAARSLYLPNNSQPAGLPVFFEGRLQEFARNVAVVLVCLDSSRSAEGAADGTLYFRGSTAVIVRGPAVVELAFPFQVE